jgi:hypothetical protein
MPAQAPQGSLGSVHLSCLRRWADEKRTYVCELCEWGGGGRATAGTWQALTRISLLKCQRAGRATANIHLRPSVLSHTRTRGHVQARSRTVSRTARSCSRRQSAARRTWACGRPALRQRARPAGAAPRQRTPRCPAGSRSGQCGCSGGQHAHLVHRLHVRSLRHQPHLPNLYGHCEGCPAILQPA